MAGGDVRNYDMSSLPPDYVSLMDLKVIWMKKQEEKKLKEREEAEKKQAAEKRKQEEEELRKQEAELRKQEEVKRNNGGGKMGGGGGNGRILVGGRVSRKGLIDEKGKGKEVINGGYGNGEGNQKRLGERNFRNPNFGGDGKNVIELGKEKFRVEKEMGLVNGVRGGIPDGRRMGFRGGFRGAYGRGGTGNEGGYRANQLKQNDDGDGVNQLKQNEGGSDIGGGVLDDKKRGVRGRINGGYLDRDNRLKESRVVVKGNGVEIEQENVKKGEDEVIEVLGEGSGLRGRGRNGYRGRNMTKEGGRNGKYQGRYGFRVKESRETVVIGSELEKTEKKIEDEVLVVFDEKCCLSERDRKDDEKDHTNEGKFEGEGSNDDKVALESKVDDGGLMVESVKNGEKEGVGKGNADDEIVEVTGESSGLRGRGKNGNKGRKWSKGRRNRKYQGTYNRVKESTDDVVGNGLELKTENKAENEDKVQGEGLGDDGVALESEVDDGVLEVESEKNDEREGVGKGYMNSRRGKWNGNGERRNRFGRSNDHQNMKRGGGGMMWVKKEEKSGADADAAAGSSGVQTSRVTYYRPIDRSGGRILPKRRMSVAVSNIQAN